MLKNHNNNIISGVLKAIAAFWCSAARFQIFVILAAIGLMVILPFIGDKLNSATDTVLNIIIFCAIAAAGFLLLRLKDSHLAVFTFASALLLRICLVFIMETASPDIYMCYDDRIDSFRWIRHYDSVLLQSDEFFYAYYTQAYKDITVSEFIHSPEFVENAHRASFLMSRIMNFFGDEFIWIRLTGAFLGAFAAAFVCLAAQMLFNKDTASIVSLLAALAVQTAFYSVRFLKEAWVILAVSMMIFGISMILRNKKLLLAILPITIAVIILIWIRFECFLIFTAVIPIAICFRHKSNTAVKSIAVLIVILLGVVIIVWQFDQLANKAERLLDRFTITERAKSGRLETLDRIYKSRGPLRLLNIPLSILNPPPKNLHYIIAPANGLYDIVLQADIWQWWLSLPFLTIGTIIIISRRTEFLVFLLPYIITISTSALLLGGLTPSLCRYRDSLASLVFIIIGIGLESFTTKKMWKNSVILFTYAVFIMLTIYFYLI